MKKIFFGAIAVAILAGTAMAKKEEPIIMTVNGKPVYKSEFEYLYNKNAGQQIEHQSLDAYADMFVKYKLKVADAEAAGLDTTAAVRNELEQFKVELAQPFMRDKSVEDKLLKEAYDHYANQVKVAHIMLQPAQNPTEEATRIALLDSIRTEILAGRLDWADAAARYSIDRGSSTRGGEMGWLIAGRYPWPFEEMAYNTKKGEISKPVNSGYGYHIIRVEDQRKNPGEVNARHILKLTSRKPADEVAMAKTKIDSIYNVLAKGDADFADVATRESEDPGSARKGGDLGWFSAGMMVAPFDSAVFAMKPGEISAPIETAFGWHIIEKLGERPIKPFNEMKDELTAVINNDVRGTLPEKTKLESLLKKFNSHLEEANLDKIQSQIAANEGGYDSTMIAALAKNNMPVAKVGSFSIPLSEVMQGVAVTASKDAANARGLIASTATRLMNNKTLELERADMLKTNPEYRNLVNEYRDGILLFEISQEKVWQKASADREGLQNFFKTHKANYTFDEPRFKGYIVFIAGDSLETAAKEYIATLPAEDLKPENFSLKMREKFGKNVRVERVIARKGENPITDYLAFDGPRPDAKVSTWTNYFTVNGKIVDQPEDADDVRGPVTTDYQNALEEQWVDELRSKYPVKIDRKVLSTVKELTGAPK